MKHGSLRHAESYLVQAQGLDVENRNIANEVGYLKMKRAVVESETSKSKEMFEEAFKRVEELIAIQRDENVYPYHVLGSQTIAWTERSDVLSDHKRELYEKGLKYVEQGLERYPSNSRLLELKKEYFALLVSE